MKGRLISDEQASEIVVVVSSLMNLLIEKVCCSFYVRLNGRNNFNAKGFYTKLIF
jgi:hypothetical protein